MPFLASCGGDKELYNEKLAYSKVICNLMRK